MIEEYDDGGTRRIGIFLVGREARRTMNPILLSDPPRAKPALAALFRKSPVLVEVRFPRMATSPDWYLCDEETDLATILERLGPGAEIHLNSVWDLKNKSGATILRK